MYLDSRALNWVAEIQSWSEIDKKVRGRAEELLSRAELHLNINKSRDSRADCLVTLKRALNQRLNAIEKIHEFKKLDIPNKPKGYLELLEKVGIVRPLLLKKLLKIRNDIEHEDVPPPSYNQCKEHVDVVWYFLKSTNKHVSMKSTDVIFKKLRARGEETQYWINLRAEDNRFEKIHITGWFPKGYLRRKTKDANYLPLDLNDIGTKEERWPGNVDHQDKLPTDIWANGYIVLANEQRLNLIQQILNV